MSDMCDYPGCTAPIINGVPLCYHGQTDGIRAAMSDLRKWNEGLTPDDYVEPAYCEGCDQVYDPQEESHVGHEVTP